MNAAALKRCIVAFATPERQWLWPVELPAQASIAEALDAAERMAPDVTVPWAHAPVGIFGELRDRRDVPADGDRIELYRPLPEDPRARRRARLARQRR